MFDASFASLLTQALTGMLLPPLNGLLPLLAGWLARRRRRRLGRALMAFGLIALTLQSLGVVSRALTVPLETAYPPLQPGSHVRLEVDAIVVPGALRYRNAPEFGGDDVAGPALERLRYGALLARASGKPLLVSGGAPDGGTHSEAEAMQRSLERDFGVEARWLETESATTWENAGLSARLLRENGAARIALVTHAWHMPRAVLAFEAAGLSVLPAPTGFVTTHPLAPQDFVPSARALQGSARAVHEWLGLAWYRIGR